jgi:uncharacterized lipoprotein YmbA
MMNCFFHRFEVFVLFGLLLALSGCITAASPPSQFYLLSPWSESNEKPQKAIREQRVVIGVGPVEVPEYLNRPQIVTRISPFELKLAEFNHWAEPLKGSFSRVIVENLSSLLCNEAIAVFAWRGSVAIDYRVEVEVLRLDGELDINAILDARWAIFREQDREVLFAEKSSISEAVSGQGYEALVSAQSRAIWELSRQIAGEIARMRKPVAKASRASEKEPLSQHKMLYHEVRRGDTLSRISKKYGVSVDEICRLNNTTKEKIIYPGQRLLIAPVKNQ